MNPILAMLKLANSDDLRVGDFAVAIGNPFGLSHTVTSGIAQPSITCYGIHDYAALHFVDGKLLATVTSFPDAGVLIKTGNEENILRG